jgi:hypothetical protein
MLGASLQASVAPYNHHGGSEMLGDTLICYLLSLWLNQLFKVKSNGAIKHNTPYYGPS